MIQKIKAPISVISFFNHKKLFNQPILIKWEGKSYKVNKLGFHHKYKIGTTVFHSYSVTCNDTFFKIVLNTSNLHWELEEISDGEAD